MLYLSHLIRTGDNPQLPWREINLNTPWPSFIHRPGQTWNDMKRMLNTTILSDGTPVKDLWDHPSYKFRVFKAHEAPIDSEFGGRISVLPLKKTIKYLAMYRNLPDILASFYPFVNSHNPKFIELWGGFPPKFFSKSQMLMMLFQGPNPVGLEWLLYLKLWWKNRNESNVLLLHYNDCINDLDSITRKLIKFYEVDLSEKQIKSIVEKASFKSMKAMTNSFSYVLWGAHPELTAMQHGKQIRRGVTGESKSFFNKEELEYINKIVDDYFQDDPQLKEWSRIGGEY